MKKKLIWGIIITLFTIVMVVLIKEKVVQEFLQSYWLYLSKNIEHQAKLFESAIRGLCAGMVTFGALFITIKHENNKERKRWDMERKKEKEERLLSVRPFLNIECQNVSMLRSGKIENIEDCMVVGAGEYHRYVKIHISNQGFGKCNKIFFGNKRCSINQLESDEKKELTVYFMGFDVNSFPTQFSMSFSYQNIFGNKYMQQFSCVLDRQKPEMEINIGEPLLKEEGK